MALNDDRGRMSQRDSIIEEGRNQMGEASLDPKVSWSDGTVARRAT